MKLKVLASGSKGNSYILENDKEALVIEAGVPFKELVRHVDHRKIVGCLVSHEHQDHAKYLDEYYDRGVSIFAPHIEDDLEIALYPEEMKGFGVVPFENHHNVRCYGFIITHREMGKMIFSTDTGYIDYRFKDVNHWMIECNYSKELMDRAVENGLDPYHADRVVRDHMSLETCKDFFKANDLSRTRNIVLLHLSDGNSNAEEFKQEIQQLTKRDTYTAEKGLEIDFSLCPI